MGYRLHAGIEVRFPCSAVSTSLGTSQDIDRRLVRLGVFLYVPGFDITILVFSIENYDFISYHI